MSNKSNSIFKKSKITNPYKSQLKNFETSLITTNNQLDMIKIDYLKQLENIPYIFTPSENIVCHPNENFKKEKKNFEVAQAE